jgi:muconolactone delta-isomerase
MRWNLKGMTFNQLWDLEGQEAKAAAKSIEEGIVTHLYKAVAEEYVMSIGGAPTAEAFDRYALGVLPMREHLVFEQVLTLQEGFTIDVFSYISQRRREMADNPRFLYFTQFAWDPGSRKVDELWDDMCAELQNTRIVKVLGLYRVAAQQKVMAIVDVTEADALNQLALLPSLQTPIVEIVWLLRDYIGFAEDVEKHYRFNDA